MKATAAVMHRVNEPLAIEQVDLDAPARNERRTAWGQTASPKYALCRTSDPARSLARPSCTMRPVDIK